MGPLQSQYARESMPLKAIRIHMEACQGKRIGCSPELLR